MAVELFQTHDTNLARSIRVAFEQRGIAWDEIEVSLAGSSPKLRHRGWKIFVAPDDAAAASDVLAEVIRRRAKLKSLPRSRRLIDNGSASGVYYDSSSLFASFDLAGDLLDGFSGGDS